MPNSKIVSGTMLYYQDRTLQSKRLETLVRLIPNIASTCTSNDEDDVRRRKSSLSYVPHHFGPPYKKSLTLQFPSNFPSITLFALRNGRMDTTPCKPEGGALYHLRA